MPISSYRSSDTRRVFTNYPFRNGMYFKTEMEREGMAKIISNMDIIGSGDVAVPRSSFVNGFLHTGISEEIISSKLIKQVTRDGKPFLVSFEQSVNPDDYLSGAMSDANAIDLQHPFGMHIITLAGGIEELTVEEGSREIVIDEVIDGDTFDCHTVAGNEPMRVRLLGIDTPELIPLPKGIYATQSGSPERLYIKNLSGWTELDYKTTTDHTTFMEYDFINEDYIYYDGSYYTGTIHSTEKTLIEIAFESVGVLPEYEDNGATTAKSKLTTHLNAFDGYILIYDKNSPQYDAYQRVVAHVFGYNLGNHHPERFFYAITSYMLAGGYGEIKYLQSNYLFYDNYVICSEYAKTEKIGIYSTEYPTEYYTDSTLLANIEFDIRCYDSYSGTIPQYSIDVNTKHFKKPIYTLNEIHPYIYSSESYFNEDKTALDWDLSIDHFVEILEHNYSNSEYHVRNKHTEFPYANMSWQNAVSFLGRIRTADEVKYKGLITLQYDGNQHYILIQEPKEVHLGTLNIEDPYSMSFNALDDDPYVYEDYFGADAETYIRPSILGVYLYKGDKVLQSVGTKQDCYIRPYIAFPEISDTGYVKTSFRYITPNDERDKVDWVDFDESEVDVTDHSTSPGFGGALTDAIKSAGDKVWNFANVRGKPVEFELRNIFRSNSSPTTDDAAYHDTTYEIIEDEVPVGTKQSYDVQTDVKFLGATTLSTMYADFRYEVRVIINGAEHISVETVREEIESVVQDTLITLEINFFKIKVEFLKDNMPLNIYRLGNEVLMNARYEEWIARGSTYPIFNNGEKTLDAKDMLDDHNVWDATHLTVYDRFLILYGEAMGNYSLQFTEFETTDSMPFPYGQIIFDSPIIHVHPHQGNLYVFCEDGIWMLHSGMDYTNMLKTFAYSGVQLDPSEKATVVSLGNEVFFVHESKGYVIRSNYQVESSSDIYVMPITAPVNDILRKPSAYIKERLQDAYGIIAESTANITVTYRSIVKNDTVYLIASYNLGTVKDTLMVMYIYEKEYRRFRMYDTYAGAFPIMDYHSSGPNGFGLILQNSLIDPHVTAAEFMYYLPENITGYELGDARPIVYEDSSWRETNETEAITKVQSFMDTGGLGLNSLHKKRVRRHILTIVNFEGVELAFNIIPYTDGIMLENATNIQAVLDEYGDIVEQADPNVKIIVPSVTKFITFAGLELDGFTITGEYLTTYKFIHLETKVNALGKLPGFKVYLPATHRFEVSHYGIVYRQYSAR